MKRLVVLIALLAHFSSGSARPDAATIRKPLWQGVIHLGDNPGASVGVTSGGLAFQAPFKPSTFGKARLIVTAAEIQTLAGEGHYVELVAHFEGQQGGAPAKEIVAKTFRIKDQSKPEKEYAFELDTSKNVEGMRPDYYSVRVKIDTSVQYSLWDDFLVRRIDLEPFPD